VGPVVTDTMGVSGEAIIIAARLVEAPLFKEAMSRARAALGVIASTFIYESVLRHDPSLGRYSQVQVDVKESRDAGLDEALRVGGSVSPGSPWPPTSSKACWRWCQRSRTRPVGGCTISADAVTCSGRSRW